MSQAITKWEGRVVFHMHPRNLKAKLAMSSLTRGIQASEWGERLRPDSPGYIPAAVTAVSGFITLVGYTDKIEFHLPEGETSELIAFKAWWEARHETALDAWLEGYTELVEGILDEWADASNAVYDLAVIPIERKPPEAMTDEERLDATNLKVKPGKLVGGGGKSKLKKGASTSPPPPVS
jgi:hypothetical protein